MSGGGRKEKRNIGPVTDRSVPSLATARSSVMMVERLIVLLLKETTNKIKDDDNELNRFFSHFFDPTAGEAERKEFVKRFKQRPPKTLMGYARSTSQFPCFAVVLNSDDEQEALVGDYIGQTLPDDHEGEATEYEGAFFDSVYATYIYSEHPDECAFLYQYAKAVLHGGKEWFLACGVEEVTLSGGELAPDENYMPENMFVRVLRVNAKSQLSVPRLMRADPRKLRLGGLYLDDIVVDGVRGGIHPKADLEGGE